MLVSFLQFSNHSVVTKLYILVRRTIRVGIHQLERVKF